MKHRSIVRGYTLTEVVFVLAVIAFWGTVGMVALHFIIKFW
jgi:prepilin-type N-terminal cleavage/methylation domain-containing protein